MANLILPASNGQLIFVDTPALFALAFPRDQNNAAAKQVFRQLIDLLFRFLTTNYVVAEYHALLVKRVGARYANEALQAIDSGAIEILVVTETDELAGRTILAGSPASGYTLADAIAFGVMSRLGIQFAFTFDNHFAMHGFELPVPQS